MGLSNIPGTNFNRIDVPNASTKYDVNSDALLYEIWQNALANLPGDATAANQLLEIAQLITANKFLQGPNLCVFATAAVANPVTLTIPAAGPGLFHYITNIELTCYSAGTRTGAATPNIFTSTNLGGMTWNATTSGTIGTIERILETFKGLKSDVANTNTVITIPFKGSTIFSIRVNYYTGI